MLYQWLIRLLSPLIGLLIISDAIKRKGGWPYITQRLGLSYPDIRFPNPQADLIWLHCASVGEVKAAETLINRLSETFNILVSTSTPTGMELLNKSFRHDNIQHRYLPMDWPMAIRRFLATFNDPTSPVKRRLWVIETEIWPNLYTICARQGFDISILNGRLSRKSMQAPSWLKKTYRHTLQQVDRVLTISQNEAERFIELGANQHTVHALGNLKFSGLHALSKPDRPIDRRYILAASTHSGEEAALAKLWLKMKRSELLVVVPRHPERRDRILQDMSFVEPDIKSASMGHRIDERDRIFLDDRIGKLMPLFAHAECVIMGGAFTPRGGHNVLEPAAYGRAILTGPDMSDFEAELDLLLEYDAIIQCKDYQELEKCLVKCLTDKEFNERLGFNARKAIESQQHVLDGYLELLLS